MPEEKTTGMYSTVRSDDQVNEILNTCSESEETGVSKFPSMTYEQGIEQAILWLTGQIENHPLED